MGAVLVTSTTGAAQRVNEKVKRQKKMAQEISSTSVGIAPVFMVDNRALRSKRRFVKSLVGSYERRELELKAL